MNRLNIPREKKKSREPREAYHVSFVRVGGGSNLNYPLQGNKLFSTLEKMKKKNLLKNDILFKVIRNTINLFSGANHVLLIM